MPLTYHSFFSGIGTFDYGLRLAGWKMLSGCEKDATARTVLARHFPEAPLHDDICTLSGNTLSPAPVVIGGFPCQDVSSAGRREGMAQGSGTRSSLFYEAVRVIQEMRDATANTFPRIVLIENVPGLLSSPGQSRKGRDFQAVLEALIGREIPMPRSGRWRGAGVVRGNGREVAWRVLDSQYFGVAQRRRRLYIVLDFAGRSAGEILFERDSRERTTAPGGQAWHVLAHRPGQGAGMGHPAGDQQSGLTLMRPVNHGKYIPDTLAGTLVTQNRQGDTANLIVYPHTVGAGAALAFHLLQDPISGPLSPCISAAGQATVGVMQPLAFSLTQEGGAGGASVTPPLAASSGGGNQPHVVLQHEQQFMVRRLTPTECARLQAMPDDWAAGQSDTAQYRQYGNGGTSSVLLWLGLRIARVIQPALEASGA